MIKRGNDIIKPTVFHMRLNIKVIPNAKQNKLVHEAGRDNPVPLGNRYRVKVYLTAPPVDGKANKALIEFLSEYYKVKKSAVRILRGEKGREKVVEIDGL